MRKPSQRPLLRLAAGGVAVMLAAGTAQATDGYFQDGYGARQKALAGLGVADGRDATTISLNPAGLVDAPNETTFSISINKADRAFTSSSPVTPPLALPEGTVESRDRLLPIISAAASYRLGANPFFDVVGFSVHTNASFATDYPAVARPACINPGIYCDGAAGLSLQQWFLSLAGARRFGSVSVGIAPTIALQTIEAKGLGTQSPSGPSFNFQVPSVDPAHYSGNGVDTAFAAGIRGGIEWKALPGIRLGVAGSTRMWSTTFADYRGLLAEGGNFDIPANLQVGIAVDLLQSLTFMADYKRIWYGSVPALHNLGSLFAGLYGAPDGPGLGWGNEDVFKLGVEWRTSTSLTLRAGYSYSPQTLVGETLASGPVSPSSPYWGSPMQSRVIGTFNILAGGIVQRHVTAGAQLRIARDLDLELGIMYAPERAISDGSATGHSVTLSERQLEATIGMKYRFGAADPPPR